MSIEQDSMGFDITDQSRKHALEIANLLVKYKDWIQEKTNPSLGEL